MEFLTMPNGGSDCCGTCWFNRKNRGEKGYPKDRDNDVEPYCEIRHVLDRESLLDLLRQPPAPKAQPRSHSDRTANASFWRWIEQRSRNVDCVS